MICDFGGLIKRLLTDYSQEGGKRREERGKRKEERG